LFRNGAKIPVARLGKVIYKSPDRSFLMKSDVEKPAKKPYERPKLYVYGDIRTITKSVGSGTISDSAPGIAGKSKTH
jgi:hypothetical protein